MLDNNNLHSSPVVTVVPLSSGTINTTYQRDVFLGQELYIKLYAKNKSLLDNAKQKLNEQNEIIRALTDTIHETQNAGITTDKLESIQNVLSNSYNQMKEIQTDIKVLEKYSKEIFRMKQGSVAMMEQITTISKMRIYIPKKSTDILYGISFSPEAMERINTQLKNLYLRIDSVTLLGEFFQK